jgi:U3 small nucleolar ribonucleoprotein protein IMP4
VAKEIQSAGVVTRHGDSLKPCTMLRRDVRLRREYLYRKSLEQKEQALLTRKRQLKEALAADKPIPTELRKDAHELKHSLELDDPDAHVSNVLDDEYASAGVNDPRLLITTSHDPSSKLTQFLKELRLVFPNCHRMNRGGTSMKELVDVTKAEGFTDLIIVHETRGVPDGMIVSHMPNGPTAYFNLSNTILRHDIEGTPNVPEVFPHLIFENFSTKLGNRVSTILKHLFPVPRADASRIVTCMNRDDYVSFRHHVYKKQSYKEVDLLELGPRFEMKVYQIKLGTPEQAEAENEWTLRPYMNTAKKRKML